MPQHEEYISDPPVFSPFPENALSIRSSLLSSSPSFLPQEVQLNIQEPTVKHSPNNQEDGNDSSSHRLRSPYPCQTPCSWKSHHVP